MFHNFIQLFPSLPLFLNLRPTGRTSSFILRSPTIKTHVHRQPNRTSLPLRTAQTSFQNTHPKLCISLARLHIPFALRRLSHFVAFRTSLPVAFCRLLHFVACRTLSHRVAPYRSSSLLIVSSQILLGILFIYIFSLFSHSSHRLLKKGLTSTCTFLTFCRFIPLQAYHFGAHREGLVFKISSQPPDTPHSLWSTWP